MAAEEAKIFLSSHDHFLSKIGNLYLDLDKTTFETLILPVIQKTMDSVRLAVKDSGLKTEEIDKVILVGGSSRIPLIKNTSKNFLGLLR